MPRVGKLGNLGEGVGVQKIPTLGDTAKAPNVSEMIVASLDCQRLTAEPILDFVAIKGLDAALTVLFAESAAGVPYIAQVAGLDFAPVAAVGEIFQHPVAKFIDGD